MVANGWDSRGVARLRVCMHSRGGATGGTELTRGGQRLQRAPEEAALRESLRGPTQGRRPK